MSGVISLMPVTAVPPGSMRRATAGGRDVVVVNADGHIIVLPNQCPHAGAALHQGALLGCILTCPWHGSQFDVCAGTVQRGPATAALPPLASRIVGGWVVLEV